MEVDQDYQRHRQSRGSTSSRFEDKADTNEPIQHSNPHSIQKMRLKKILRNNYCQGYEQKAIGIGLCPC